MTQQRDLFFDPAGDRPERYAPHAPNSDTSKAAADSQTNERLSGDEERIYNLIRSAGAHGMTCDEIEDATDLCHQTASARVRGLKLKERIVPSPSVMRKTRRGRMAEVLITKRGDR